MSLAALWAAQSNRTASTSLLTKRPRDESTDPATLGTTTAEQRARAERNRAAAVAKRHAVRVGQAGFDQDAVLAMVGGGGWERVLGRYVRGAAEFAKLLAFVNAERRGGAAAARVFPPAEDVFAAFLRCRFEEVKVVVIGQDPYHGPRQAHGMCFSVRKGVTPPPSLENIFRELETDVSGFKRPSHGCLESWADQGVLLLNAVLTVRQGQPTSHQGKGWERFTDEVIRVLNEKKAGIVFMLWGRYAQDKGKRIDKTRHCVLKASHPSPLSANRGGWSGTRHFSSANRYLKSRGQKPVDWTIP